MPSRLEARAGTRVGICLLLFCPQHGPQMSEPHSPVRLLPALCPVKQLCARVGGSLSVSSPCGGSVLEVHVGAEPLQPWGARFSPRVLSVIRRNERRFRISGETWGQAVHVSGRQDREGATATASGTSVCVGALLSSGSSIAYLGHSPSFIINKQLLGAGLSRHWEQLWPRRGSSRACALVGTGVRQWACRNDGGGGCYFHLEPGAGHQLGDLLDLEFTFQPCACLIV